MDIYTFHSQHFIPSYVVIPKVLRKAHPKTYNLRKYIKQNKKVSLLERRQTNIYVYKLHTHYYNSDKKCQSNLVFKNDKRYIKRE